MNGHSHFSEGRKQWTPGAAAALFLSGLCLTGLGVAVWAQGQNDNDRDDDAGRLSALIRAEQPPAPCTSNETAVQDVTTVSRRGDVVNLPDSLKTRLLQLAARPHTYLPIHAFAEAVNSNGSPKPSQHVSILSDRCDCLSAPGINDNAQQTAANQANCALPTKGAVRLVVEPKPGLPTDPNDPRAFIEIFTDVSGLFVINNESGWYEG